MVVKPQKLPADNASVMFLECMGQPLDLLVEGFFGLLVFGIIISLEQTQNQEHAADCAADLPEPSHASAKGRDRKSVV